MICGMERTFDRICRVPCCIRHLGVEKKVEQGPVFTGRKLMFVNRIRIRVEFGDCDPAKIVFYANYFRWFDQCTSALFRAAGLPLGELFKSYGVVGIPLVEARARFITP